MSQELLDHFQNTAQNPAEDSFVMKMVLECAPLLLGLRIANIIKVNQREYDCLKELFRGMGISFYRIAAQKGILTLLLYRKSLMRRYMKADKVKEILSSIGYPPESPEQWLLYFSFRYNRYLEGKGEFPHEMGFFLGYPVEDVIGYLKNNGKNPLLVGCWKVYHNKKEKAGLFEKFEEAKELLLLLVLTGFSVREAVELVN